MVTKKSTSKISRKSKISKISSTKKISKILGYTLAGIATGTLLLSSFSIYIYFKISKEINDEVDDLRKNFYDKNGYYNYIEKIKIVQKIQKKIHKFLSVYGIVLKGYKGIDSIYSDLRTVNRILEKLEKGGMVTSSDLKKDNYGKFDINNYIEKEDKQIFSKKLSLNDIKKLKIKYHPDNVPRKFKNLSSVELQKKILDYGTVFSFLTNYK